MRASEQAVRPVRGRLLQASNESSASSPWTVIVLQGERFTASSSAAFLVEWLRRTTTPRTDGRIASPSSGKAKNRSKIVERYRYAW